MAQVGGVSSARSAPTELSPASSRPARDYVSEIQRARILVAMAEAVCERGARDVAVAHVIEGAGVSRRTFYEIFAGREDCFLAAFGEAIARADSCVAAVYDTKAEWAERVRKGLEALLGFLKREPALGRLATVESLGAGARALELRRRVLDRLVAAVDEGREVMNGGSSVTALTAEGIVGGVVSVIHDHLTSREDGRLAELANPLMSMIVLPYLGPAAAREELERPVASPPVGVQTALSNPLKDLGTRLTYRTIRVLAAIAANPGSSNRVIGEVSGIGDQGQISKLLRRLERLDLVSNTGLTAAKGAPNAWALTDKGGEIERAMSMETAWGGEQ